MRFVAKTRSSGGRGLFVLGGNGLFVRERVDRVFWRRLPLVPGFVKCIACLRLGIFGGFALVGRGR